VLECEQGMIPAFSACCCDLVQRWKKLAGPQGSCELDVASEFNILASDVIARAAFGSSYEEGKKIFDLQKDQVILVLEAFYSIYFPGLRYILMPFISCKFKHLLVFVKNFNQCLIIH
jgi:hypothetical protein